MSGLMSCSTRSRLTAPTLSSAVDSAPGRSGFSPPPSSGLVPPSSSPTRLSSAGGVCNTCHSLKTVFRIHDILVWIRIRGSMPLSNRSGYCYFRHWRSRRQQKTNFKKKFFCLLLFEATFTSFFKDKKVQRKSHNSRNRGFSYYFCLMIEGSGSGSIPQTSGTGSGRPKNMWIRWIRIRIRNTD